MKIQNLSSGVRVLDIASNLVISRRCQDVNGKEMHHARTRAVCRVCHDVLVAAVVDLSLALVILS